MGLEKIDYNVDDLLKDPEMIDRFVSEIGKRVAGEEDTIKAIFVHLFCAWVKNTAVKTHLMINSESSAGKSFICNQIRKIFPKEFYEYRTKITAEALTYWHNSKNEPEWTWDGKFLYLEDVRDDVLNSSTFKVMASEGSTATVVIKQIAIDIEIKGCPVIIITSADASPNSEIVNRFSIINMDESPEQTVRIMKKQFADAIFGNHEKYNPIFPEAIKKILRCDVRLPDWVNNIIKHIPKDNMRIRRDIPRFLDIIKASAIIHQNQREFDIATKIVYANEKDYDVAKNVYKKIDEAGGSYGLTHRLKKCLESCKKYFNEKEEYFTVKEIFSFDPIVSERQWVRILEALSQRGLLKVNLRKPDENSMSKKPTTEFYPNSLSKIKLPSIKELLNDNKDTNDNKDSKDINDTLNSKRK